MKVPIARNKFLKSYLVIFAIVLCANFVKAQSNYWHAFENSKSRLIGFKNKKGGIEIPAKFDNLSKQTIFNNIIAVHEYKSDKTYYLLKNGNRIGIDSMYVFDNGYDEENEGKIRFRDKKTDKVGFFDIKGKIVIPAEYDDAQPFHNGFALVTHHGKRVCMDGNAYNPKSPCEDWRWDGKTALINIHGNIIADNLQLDEFDNIDWYKLKITKTETDTTIYYSFKSKAGSYYSFLNYKKEFTRWFNQIYLSNLSYKGILNSSYKKVLVEETLKRKSTALLLRSNFLHRYQNVLIKEMKAIKTGVIPFNFFTEDLNNYEFTDKQFPSFYYLRAENPYKKSYPVFNVVVNHETTNTKLDYQDQFEFIRTENGYKLIEVALNVGKGN